MPHYCWEGVTAAGALERGKLVAASDQELQRQLQLRGIMLLDARRANIWHRALQWRVQVRPTAYDCHLFFAHLASFLQAGVPLRQALDIVAATMQNSMLQGDIRILVGTLDQGQSLYRGLALLPYLPSYVVPLVQASEQAGSLVPAFLTVSAMLRADHSHRQVVRDACFGPLLTVLVALGVLLLTVLLLLPQFHQLYQQCNVKPPALIAAAHTFAGWLTGPVLAGAAVIVILTVAGFRQQRSVGGSFGGLGRVPFLQHTLYIAEVQRLLTIMHAYASNGLPILAACQAALGSMQVPRARALAASCIQALEAGGQLSQALGCLDNRLAFVAPLVAIGEEAGDVVPMFAKARDEVNQVLQQQVATFTKMIGPLLTVVVGFFIGGLLVMLYLPIMQLGALVKF